MLPLFTLLDDIYGVLFLPQTTLTALRDRSVAFAGALIIVGVNILEALRQGIDTLLTTILASLVTWFLFSYLLERLGHALGKEVNLNRLLGLTGFSSLPWIFFAPALNLGGSVGTILALAVVAWFLTWQVWAVAIALEAQVVRVITLIPLAFAGSLVSITILIKSFSTLSEIGNLLHLPQV